MQITDEFTHKLRNGSEVIISAEGEVYRDEFGQAWIENLEVGFSIRDTGHYADAVTCLNTEMPYIRTHIEERLVESFDESEKESA